METAEIPTTINESKRYGLPGHYAAVGARASLENAYRTGAPVTIDIPGSPFEGDRVYLGHVQIVPDEDPKHLAELRTWTADRGPLQGSEIAAYVIDETRLQDAPRFAAALRKRTGTDLHTYAETQASVDAEAARSECGD